MRASNLVLAIFVLVFFVLVVGQVSALGITPARTTLDFSPGLQKTVGFTVVNSAHKDMNLVVYVKGELNKSISLPLTSFHMGASEASKQLTYNVNLPSNLGPGTHSAQVVVLQLPDKSQTSEAYVGAAIGVQTQLDVKVPYPGKYAEAAMNIINAQKGGQATFIIPIVNRGKDDLVNVYANVDIYNDLGTKVATFNTPSISIKSGAREQIVYNWDANVSVGNYEAMATVIYDGNTISLKKQFSVGTEELDLEQVTVNDFKLGGIAKFEMLVSNKWSQPIDNVYAETQVFDSGNRSMADFKSPTADIPALTKKVLTSYWDTAGVHEGTYPATVSLKYGDKSSQKDLELKISKDAINVVGLGFVISASNTSSKTLITILVSVVVLLVLINLSWFLFLRKRFANRNKKF